MSPRDERWYTLLCCQITLCVFILCIRRRIDLEAAGLGHSRDTPVRDRLAAPAHLRVLCVHEHLNLVETCVREAAQVGFVVYRYT